MQIHGFIHVLEGSAVDPIVPVLLLLAYHRRSVDDATTYQKVL